MTTLSLFFYAASAVRRLGMLRRLNLKPDRLLFFCCKSSKATGAPQPWIAPQPP